MDPRLENFLGQINATTSVQETWNVGLAFLRSIDLDLVMYGYSCGPLDERAPSIKILSNFPPRYHDRYRQERYFLDDPVVHHCVRNLPPHLIGVNSLPYWPDRGHAMTLVQRNIVNEAGECGLKMGVVFPLRSAGRHPVAGFSVSNGMKLDEFEHFLKDRYMLIHLGAVHTHTRIQMLVDEADDADVLLTARERECLLWASCGLSSKEVARRLDVSFKTVEFHIANAMVKLNATTRSHAIARAIALGLLHP